jgi:hypothetical protein
LNVTSMAKKHTMKNESLPVFDREGGVVRSGPANLEVPLH